MNVKERVLLAGPTHAREKAGIGTWREKIYWPKIYWPVPTGCTATACTATAFLH
jgi:hypothetical protein